MALRFFLVRAEGAAFFLAGALLVEVGLDVVLFDAVPWAGAVATGDGAGPVSTDDLD
jgi:hypothetical protein